MAVNKILCLWTCVCVSSRLVCQVLVTFTDNLFYEEELVSQSQIIISKNEQLCLFCCVNKRHCVFFVFYLFSSVLFNGCQDSVCKHAFTGETTTPWRPCCTIADINIRYLYYYDYYNICFYHLKKKSI